MNISHIINEDLYNEIWKVVWSDCRQTVTKQTSPHMPIAIYHSIACNCLAFILVGYCLGTSQWLFAALNLCIHVPLFIWNIRQYKKHHGTSQF